MQFNHTLTHVLNGTKTQTSRVWRGYYVLDGDCVRSQHNGRILYQVGQRRAIQPGRGHRGGGWIRITALECRDVRGFTVQDIVREGFTNKPEFLTLWRHMHGDKTLALVIRFELLQDGS